MKPCLIPTPKKMRTLSGVVRITDPWRIFLDATSGDDDLFAATLLQRELRESAGLALGIDRLHKCYGDPGPCIRLVRDASAKALGPEGYQLRVDRAGIELRAATSAGLFYAVQTLRQLVREFRSAIPRLTIEDRPDFPVRGVLHDVCRGKVPKLETLMSLVETLSFFKVNLLSLHIEHTFAFKKHPLIGKGDSPLSAEDILRLQAHCRKHHVELMPTLQSFGHMEHILKLPPYKGLAESEMGWTLCPTDPGTYALLEDMFCEFAPLFESARFNICSDETYDLGKGRSRPVAEHIGLGKLYLRHVKRLRSMLKRLGKQTLFWGDIVLNHPEVIADIPKDMVLLNWGYRHDHDVDSSRLFQQAKLTQWVCPGTNSCQAITARLDMARPNIRRFAQAGLKYGAQGLLNTDWGDYGHPQMLAASLYGFAFGAQKAWNVRGAGRGFDRSLSLQYFGDPSGDVTDAIRALSTAEEICALDTHPRSARGIRSALWDVLWEHREWAGETPRKVTPESLSKATALARSARQAFKRLRPERSDVQEDVAELLLSADLITYAAQKTLALKRPSYARRRKTALAKDVRDLQERFEERWLCRNRPSNLADLKKRLAAPSP